MSNRYNTAGALLLIEELIAAKLIDSKAAVDYLNTLSEESKKKELCLEFESDLKDLIYGE